MNSLKQCNWENFQNIFAALLLINSLVKALIFLMERLEKLAHLYSNSLSIDFSENQETGMNEFKPQSDFPSII